MLTLYVTDALLWTMATWYGAAWLRDIPYPRFSHSSLLLAMLLTLGVAPFVATAVTGVISAPFLISGGVFLLAFVATLITSGRNPAPGRLAGASTQERFIMTAGLAAVVTAIIAAR